MGNDDGEVEKETFFWQEKEIGGDVGERGSDVCAQEMENVFFLERPLCVASVGMGYDCVSFGLHHSWHLALLLVS